MSHKKRAYLELHTAVLLFGFAAILGDLIQLSSFMIVWWRVTLCSFLLLLFPGIIRSIKHLALNQVFIFVGIGCLLALHWLLFFASVKNANVSIAVICMASSSLFTAFTEPFFLKRKIQTTELVFALLMIPAVSFMYHSIHFQFQMGFSLGLCSALLLAISAALNKKYISSSNPLSITFLEMLSAGLFFAFLMPIYFLIASEERFFPNPEDWKYVLALGFICTAGGQYLSIKSLRHLSAFTTNFVLNLEPVYGILLAILLLNDLKELSTSFYLGVVIILLLVLIYPIIDKKLKQT